MSKYDFSCLTCAQSVKKCVFWVDYLHNQKILARVFATIYTNHQIFALYCIVLYFNRNSYISDNKINETF